MSEFTNITGQRVRHVSGYEVYSAGREYVGYQDEESIYKFYKEYGWDVCLGKEILYIYTNDVYNNELNKVFLQETEKNIIIDKIVKAEEFMTNFRIELVPL